MSILVARRSEHHRFDFLLRRIFPRQAEVISSADLNGLLQ
jgi:hypothetical protein